MSSVTEKQIRNELIGGEEEHRDLGAVIPREPGILPEQIAADSLMGGLITEVKPGLSRTEQIDALQETVIQYSRIAERVFRDMENDNLRLKLIIYFSIKKAIEIAFPNRDRYNRPQ